MPQNVRLSHLLSAHRQSQRTRSRPKSTSSKAINTRGSLSMEVTGRLIDVQCLLRSPSSTKSRSPRSLRATSHRFPKSGSWTIWATADGACKWKFRSSLDPTSTNTECTGGMPGPKAKPSRDRASTMSNTRCPSITTWGTANRTEPAPDELLRRTASCPIGSDDPKRAETPLRNHLVSRSNPRSHAPEPTGRQCRCPLGYRRLAAPGQSGAMDARSAALLGWLNGQISQGQRWRYCSVARLVHGSPHRRRSRTVRDETA